MLLSNAVRNTRTLLITLCSVYVDEQVWASGFLAALLKKRSSATKPGSLKGQVKEGVTVESVSVNTGATFETEGTNSFETVVLSLLEGFFSLFLRLPTINQ